MSGRTISTASQELSAREDLTTLLAVADSRRVEFTNLLPTTITWDTFKNTFKIAIQRNMRLLEADRPSLWIALQKAATDGLLPDGRESALVIFGDDSEDEQGNVVVSKANRKKIVQYLPMVNGLCKLVRNTGNVIGLRATLVYEGEKFSLREEDGGIHYIHERSVNPNFDNSSEKMIGAYAIVNYKDGGWEIEWMSRSQIDRRRAVSRAKKGPWGPWYDEQSAKTVLKSLCNRIEQSPINKLTAALDRDDGLVIDQEGNDQRGRNLVPTPGPTRRAAPDPQTTHKPAMTAGTEVDGSPDPSDPQFTRDEDNSTGLPASAKTQVATPAAPAVTRPPQTSGVTSPGGEQPGTDLLLYPTDEFGEAVPGDGVEFLVFSSAIEAVRHVEAALMHAKSPETLLENNRDMLDEALAADADVKPILDDMTVYISNRKAAAEKASEQANAATQGDAQADPVPAAASDAPAPPKPVPLPSPLNAKAWQHYRQLCGVEIGALGSEADIAAWRDLNLANYMGKAVEPGIDKLLRDRWAELQPKAETVDADEKTVLDRIRDINGCGAPDDLRTFCISGIMKTLKERLTRERPELWKRITDAADARMAVLQGGAR